MRFYCTCYLFYRFDFTGKTTLPCDETSVVHVQTIADGKVDAVFMWWDLEMDPDGEIILSCAPRWAHPTPSNMQVCASGSV